MTVHERAVAATVEWRTPASLFDRLGGVTFDLDPASAPGDVVPARSRFDKAADGLAHEWTGHVWLNPPYGPAGVRFIDRMIAHGDGLLLLPSRTETAAYQRCLDAADVVCLLRDRLWFTRSDGFRGRSSFGSTLFAFGDWAGYILLRADLGWTMFISLWASRPLALDQTLPAAGETGDAGTRASDQGAPSVPAGILPAAVSKSAVAGTT
jgi:hypothetical protein